MVVNGFQTNRQGISAAFQDVFRLDINATSLYFSPEIQVAA